MANYRAPACSKKGLVPDIIQSSYTPKNKPRILEAILEQLDESELRPSACHASSSLCGSAPGPQVCEVRLCCRSRLPFAPCGEGQAVTNKLRPPHAVCTRCGRASREIGKPCSRQFNGKRCRGTLRSMLKEDDWSECPACGATGRVDGVTCGSCGGDAYHSARAQ